jgi:hemoglobin-like flavoprotein
MLMKKIFSDYPELENMKNLSEAPSMLLKKVFSDYPELKQNDMSKAQKSALQSAFSPNLEDKKR